ECCHLRRRMRCVDHIRVDRICSQASRHQQCHGGHQNRCQVFHVSSPSASLDLCRQRISNECLLSNLISRDGCALHMLHCTEVLQQIVAMGHKRTFRSAIGTCALPPKAAIRSAK